MLGVVSTMSPVEDKLLAILVPEMLATDIAEYLVRKGMPFRETHHIAGTAVVDSLTHFLFTFSLFYLFYYSHIPLFFEITFSLLTINILPINISLLYTLSTSTPPPPPPPGNFTSNAQARL